MPDREVMVRRQKVLANFGEFALGSGELDEVLARRVAWTTAREAAGLPDLHIHDLRHSFASFAINAGIDLFAVGRILGHADHQSTMRYSHVANERLREAVEAGAAKMDLILA